MPARKPDDLLGKELPGGYRIERLLGAGAFAWVFLAESSDGPVAIKILNNEVSTAARMLFLREIKVLRALPQNPYCVRFVNEGVADGAPFLVMEYVDGHTLQHKMASKPVWSTEEACQFVMQLCAALGGLHKYGLAHRDLKPENVMISKRGSIRLMDFGLVKDAQGLLKLFETEDILEGRRVFGEEIDQAMLAGTPDYTAPEQLQDPLVEDTSKVRTDTWTDIYSIGLLFYQLLTGTKLHEFKGDTSSQQSYARSLLSYIEQRTRLKDAQITRPAQINPELWKLVSWALRQDPKARPRTGSEFGEVIAKYVSLGGSAGAVVGVPQLAPAAETDIETTEISFTPPSELAFPSEPEEPPAPVAPALPPRPPFPPPTAAAPPPVAQPTAPRPPFPPPQTPAAGVVVPPNPSPTGGERAAPGSATFLLPADQLKHNGPPGIAPTPGAAPTPAKTAGNNTTKLALGLVFVVLLGVAAFFLSRMMR